MYGQEIKYFELIIIQLLFEIIRGNINEFYHIFLPFKFYDWKLELIGITFLVFSIDKLIIIIILEGKNYEEFDGKLNIRRRKFM